ncbi:MAG: phosphoribosylanthranilate isomerase [Betaproteobacteria bacterium]
MMRTRIKICGITRTEDAMAAADAGADAIGLVFYAPSPRCVSTSNAAEIIRALPPYVGSVALFVNPSQAEVENVLAACPVSAMQFHGEETAKFCGQFGLPFVKAARVRTGFNLINYLSEFQDAAGWLLDAFHDDAYGGKGAVFDWALIPPGLKRPLILSGGLGIENVEEAVRRVRPWAVDVSSGVEANKGIKDAAKIAAFIRKVKHADV